MARKRFSAPVAVIIGVLVATVLLPGIAWAEPPRALPGNATAEDVRWQPGFDYDTDGCYPTPAIGPDGTLNPGLKNSGALNGNCRDKEDLDNTNSYSRSECNNGWCAYMYALYFEKDQAVAGVDCCGHRHDIEQVIVWVNVAENRADYVSVSCHGDYKTYARSSVAWESTHAKIVYHKDRGFTHCFRLAGSGETPENHYGKWQYPPLVGWYGFPPGLRDKVMTADFGHASFDLRNGFFESNLHDAKPGGIAFVATPVRQGYSHESGTGVTNTDWMRRLPDAVKFSELSIPGSHASGAYRTGGDAVVSQTMDFRAQLDAGIRAWDIRLKSDGDGLTVYHGTSRQGQNFDAEVLAAADDFLQSHPYEAVFVRIKDENGPDAGFDTKVKDALDKHARVYTGENDNPALGDIRGKIVVLQDFSSDVDLGVQWGSMNIQDDHNLTDKWQLARKWRSIRAQLDAATNGDKGVGYVNFLNGSGTGVFPYFIASGHSSPETFAANLPTGLTRGMIDTCTGNDQCLAEYPSVNCVGGMCLVAFEGTNTMTMTEIYNRPWRARYGIVYADFPGSDLIHAVYNSNNFHGVLKGKDSNRCVEAPSPSDGTAVRSGGCTNGASQTWLAASVDQFKLLGTTKCLDVRNSGPADDTVVQSYECNGTDAQRWFVDLTGQFVNVGTGKCLTEASLGNGTAIVIRTCQGSSGQTWSRR